MNVNELKHLNLKDGSHNIVDVECDFKISKKCKNKYKLQYRKALEWAKNNNGRILCKYCSAAIKQSGRANTNCKYKSLDDNFFEVVDTELKAYLLGWIASDGHIAKKTSAIIINIHKRDGVVLEQIKNSFCKELKIKYNKKRGMASLTINSKKIHEDVCKLLGIDGGGKKSDIVKFPSLYSDELRWAFLRGYFDGDGHVGLKKSRFPYPRCSISSDSISMLNSIKEFTGNPAKIVKNQIEWYGTSALDFLHKLYVNAKFYLQRKQNMYCDISTWVPGLIGAGNFGNIDKMIWCKADKMAVAPFKSRASDSGYDLTIIKKLKNDGLGVVEFFDTGIKIMPPFGYYYDLVARSSLAKTGYILPNSIGVIDRAYTGTILVPLIRLDHSFPPIKLPARIVQIILRPIIHIDLHEVDNFDNNITTRNDNGFGSTGLT